MATPTAVDSIMNVINHYRIDLVFDIGANTGQFAREIRSAGYNGELHSFEPSKIPMKRYKRQVKTIISGTHTNLPLELLQLKNQST